MRCILCKDGETIEEPTTIKLERGSLAYIIQNIPAQVCKNCGEAYIDEKDAVKILSNAERLQRDGALVEIRQFS